MNDMQKPRSGSHVFYGRYTVDLSPRDAWAALYDAEIRARETEKADPYGVEAEILFRGDWWVLARTDLKDDVCTGRYVIQTTTPQDGLLRHKQEFMRSVTYGARLRIDADGLRVFSVVDRFSDG